MMCFVVGVASHIRAVKTVTPAIKKRRLSVARMFIATMLAAALFETVLWIRALLSTT
jgi:hypothetical protein